MNHVISPAPSILITDDDPGFREVLSGLFEPRGFRTLTAGTGEEALDIVRHETVHVLVSDLHMPRLTGLETILRVRQLRTSLPCILMSANVDPETLLRAKQADVAVWEKPVSRDRALETVRRLLRAAYNWQV